MQAARRGSVARGGGDPCAVLLARERSRIGKCHGARRRARSFRMGVAGGFAGESGGGGASRRGHEVSSFRRPGEKGSHSRCIPARERRLQASGASARPAPELSTAFGSQFGAAGGDQSYSKQLRRALIWFPGGERRFRR